MTTDLRAALRAAVLILLDPVLRNDENARVGAAERFRALADAPPTVAELLPLVDATHEARWVATTGEEMRYHHGNGCEYLRSRDHRWGQASLNRHDLTQPATLVEVTS